MRSKNVSQACAVCLLVAASRIGVWSAASVANPKPVRSMLICHLSGATDYQSRSAGAALGRMLRYRASNLPQLCNLPPLNVVERVLDQEGLDGRFALKVPDALKVAKASGQEWAVVGTVSRSEGRYIARLEIYGATTGRMIGRPIVASGTEAELPRIEVDLARALFGGIGLSLSEQQQSDLNKPLTAEYKAVRFLGDYLLAPARTSSALLDKALTADTKFPVSAVHRVDRALESGRFPDAIAICREWRKKLPTNRDIPSYEFGALLALKRYNEARKLLEALDSLYPDSFSLALLRHWLYRLEGNYGGALEAAEHLNKLNPQSAEGHARVAVAALEHGLRTGSSLYLSQMTPGQAREFAASIESACSAGEKAVRLDPKYEQVWLVLQTAYREKGEYSRSGEAFHRILALNAGCADAKRGQALTYLCQSKTRPARKLLEEVLKAGPEEADVLLGLALCSKMEGDTSAANLQFRRARSINERAADMTYLRYQRNWPIQLAEAASNLGRAR